MALTIREENWVKARVAAAVAREQFEAAAEARRLRCLVRKRRLATEPGYTRANYDADEAADPMPVEPGN